MAIRLMVALAAGIVGTYGFIAFFGVLWFFTASYTAHLIAALSMMVIGYRLMLLGFTDTWRGRGKAILGVICLSAIALFIWERLSHNGDNSLVWVMEGPVALCALFMTVAPLAARKGKVTPNGSLEPTR